MKPICEFLEWDSEFFGRRIGRVRSSSLSEELVSEIEAWCRGHRIECLYFLASSADQRTVRLAEDHKFRFVDIRLALELDVEAVAKERVDDPPFTIRNAVAGDIRALRDLARIAHRDSRFYNDGNFPVELCDALYDAWIEKSCRGWAKNVLVAETGDEIEGYLTCHMATSESESGQIGLVGVSDKTQGKGIGRALVSHAIRWFAGEGAEKITVVTQGRNVRAQRLYQKCGFATRSVELWYHRWFLGSSE